MRQHHHKMGQIKRRHFLHTLAGFSGTVAIHQLLGTLPSARLRAEIPRYPADIGRGKRVIVIGAGITGICSAYHLAKSGFDVTVLEANNRYGGRSLTVRPGDSFQEEGGPVQTCQFRPFCGRGCSELVPQRWSRTNPPPPPNGSQLLPGVRGRA